MLELTAAETCNAIADTCDVPADGCDTAPACEQEESHPEEQAATATALSQQAVAHHYWDWHEDMAPKTAFRWCLPASPFSRGYWARSAKESTSDSSTAAVVRNTF